MASIPFVRVFVQEGLVLLIATSVALLAVRLLLLLLGL